MLRGELWLLAYAWSRLLFFRKLISVDFNAKTNIGIKEEDVMLVFFKLGILVVLS